MFDVNVYLDTAELLGPPFTWEKFATAAARYRGLPLKCQDRRIDSLRAIAVATSGKFTAHVPLQVWTSDHIDNLVALKAGQPKDGGCPEDSGLGWPPGNAAALVDDLVWDLAYDKSGGGACRNIEIPYGSPPLSHEDGIVYRTAEQCGDEAIKYCVTNDRAFRTADLPGDIAVLYAYEWVDLVRRSRAKIAMPRPGLGPRA